jgi:hypothetical protein
MKWDWDEIHREAFESARQGDFPNRLHWYAVDCEGYIADFDSIGFGFVPKEFFVITAEDYVACGKWIEQHKRALGAISHADLGMFCYMASDDNNNDLSETYMRWFVPDIGARMELARAPEIVRKVAGNVRYRRSFASSDRIIIPNEWECTHE